jgi:hypothetical protein
MNNFMMDLAVDTEYRWAARLPIIPKQLSKVVAKPGWH